MEMKSKFPFVLQLAALSILFGLLFLLIALTLSWNQLSWIELFSNLFLTSLFSLALLLGLMLFGSGIIRQHGHIGNHVAPFKLDGSQVDKLALWLSTVITFFASMILAVMFMN